jgi:hypothetical protein
MKAHAVTVLISTNAGGGCYRSGVVQYGETLPKAQPQ